MTCGIYEIVNTVNGKRYVGQALNIEKRWSYHRQDLSRGDHHSRYLQRAWNKYGSDAFAFRVILECDMDDLNNYEQSEIDKKSEYNVSKTAGSPKGTKHSKETIEKHRIRMMSAWETEPSFVALRSPEMRRKRGAAISQAKSSVKNYNEDETIYNLVHEYHGEIHITQKRFWKEYGLNRGSVNNLLKGRKPSLHGWTLKKAPD